MVAEVEKVSVSNRSRGMVTVHAEGFSTGAYHGNERVVVNLRAGCPSCEMRQKFGRRKKNKTHLIAVTKYMGDKEVQKQWCSRVWLVGPAK